MCSAFPKNKKQTNPDLNQTIHNNYRVSDTIDGGTVGLVSGLVSWELLLIFFLSYCIYLIGNCQFMVSVFLSVFFGPILFSLYMLPLGIFN